MSQHSDLPVIGTNDPVSNVLKWILLAVAVVSFALFGWATVLTYERAPPQPERFVTAGGAVLMTADDIVAGKAGFQKADLMDYGSLYGMGSYYGQDYTAWTLMRLAGLTEARIAQARFGKPFDAAAARSAGGGPHRDARAAAAGRPDPARRSACPTRWPAPSARCATDIAKELATTDLETGWTPAYSLTPEAMLRTADFLIYSALTTVARRPDVSWSWTENWPYEPEVGNTPTTNTFIWTWASFCFTFFAFGLVLFIYEFWLNHPDDAPMDPVLARFGPLTDSQRKVGKYFLVVAAVLLLQIAAGTIMAHAYYDRRSFYGIALHDILPFNFLRDVHIQSPIIWIGVSWIGAGLFLAPAIAGGREARGQGFLVDLLFWVTLVDRRRRADRQLARHHGLHRHTAGSGSAIRACPTSSSAGSGRSASSSACVFWSVLVFRALWPTGAMLWQATRQFWTGRIRLEHLIWAATINIAVLYVFGMIPLTGIEKSFTHHRFLALVGGASVGRAIVRVLRRQHERLSADGGRPGVAQARRARGVFRADPDLPGRRHRHRPSPLLGRRPEHVGADGQHVLVHRGAAAGAADHRGDRAVPAHPRARRRSTTGSPTPTSSARRSGTSSAPACSAAAH